MNSQIKRILNVWRFSSIIQSAQISKELSLQIHTQSERQVKDTAWAEGQDTEGAKESRLVDLMTTVRDFCNSVYQNYLNWMANFVLVHVVKATQ